MSWLMDLLSSPVVQFAASACAVFGVGALVKTGDMSWYKSLRHPSWTPPNYVFPLVWIPLKLMQSGALTLACRSGWSALPASKGPLALAVGVFAVHLGLGNLWNSVFFGQHRLKDSLPVMGAFWLSVAGSAAAFQPLNRTSALLMLPTLVWVTVAAKLNYDFVQLNPDKDVKKQAP